MAEIRFSLEVNLPTDSINEILQIPDNFSALDIQDTLTERVGELLFAHSKVKYFVKGVLEK